MGLRDRVDFVDPVAGTEVQDAAFGRRRCFWWDSACCLILLNGEAIHAVADGQSATILELAP